MWLYVLVFIIVSVVNARCYCPPQCSFPVCNSSEDFRRSTCNDLEAQSECNVANLQVTDMVNSMGLNANLYLEGLLLKNASVTPLQVSYLRSKLSEAMSWEKPVGDCSDGLATNTRLANVNDICYSMPLFEQCDALAKSVPQYFSNIHNVLSERLLADALNSSVPGIVQNGSLTVLALEFVQAMKNRDSIQWKANKIRCKSFNTTVDTIKIVPPRSSNLAPTLIVLLLLVGIVCFCFLTGLVDLSSFKKKFFAKEFKTTQEEMEPCTRACIDVDSRRGLARNIH